MRDLFKKLFSQTEVKPSRIEIEEKKFSQEVRHQFEQLKQKGLSISVFTL